MTNADDKYAYSLDDGTYKDFESVMDEVNSDYPPGAEASVGKGEIVKFYHVDFVNIDVIFESINDSACDECGEYAEDYMYKVDKEKKDDLKNIIAKWMGDNFAQPGFYGVKNIVKETVISEDNTI